MSDQKIIVLKFGGSVLTCPESYDRVVHEIYRWVRKGFKVVAVVSAMKGETDRLFTAVRQTAAVDPVAPTVASWIAIGEKASAARLALLADRAGLTANCLDAAAIELVAGGPTLDAVPQRVSVQAIQRALGTYDVLVLPGFEGRDELGQINLLGRGGSDLTAITLASFLGAQCRLIKDVAGLYEWDPNGAKSTPRRYRSLPWQTAHGLDDAIVQHKSVEVAKKHRQAFEVASLNGVVSSRVGDLPVAWADTGSPAAARPLQVTLLGAGTVGGGVIRHLGNLPQCFELNQVLVRDKQKHLSDVSAELLIDDSNDLNWNRLDVLVDCTGDLELGLWAGKRALQSGCEFITANKFLVGGEGAELHALAREQQTEFRYAAAVGGALPILERIQQMSDEGITQLRGILNGTSNYVLDRVSEGSRLAEAVRDAQLAGFAEAVPDNDLNGLDAANKLVLLLQAATGIWIPLSNVTRQGIDDGIEEQVRAAASRDCKIRQIATADIRPDRVELQVRLEEAPNNSLWGRCQAERNVLQIDTGDSFSLVAGRGAGRWPTAESVIADLLDLQRKRVVESIPVPNSGVPDEHDLVGDVDGGVELSTMPAI